MLQSALPFHTAKRFGGTALHSPATDFTMYSDRVINPGQLHDIIHEALTVLNDNAHTLQVHTTSGGVFITRR